jgi:hypothetical protein
MVLTGQIQNLQRRTPIKFFPHFQSVESKQVNESPGNKPLLRLNSSKTLWHLAGQFMAHQVTACDLLFFALRT